MSEYLLELNKIDLDDFFEPDLDLGDIVKGYRIVEHDRDTAIVQKDQKFFQIERDCDYGLGGETWWRYPDKIFEVEPVKEVYIKRYFKRVKK